LKTPAAWSSWITADLSPNFTAGRNLLSADGLNQAADEIIDEQGASINFSVTASASGEPPVPNPVNAKRVYRLMKNHGLLLARHTRRRIPRAHDGTIMTTRSNERWCSDVL
jgi:hypothetical protein